MKLRVCNPEVSSECGDPLICQSPALIDHSPLYSKCGDLLMPILPFGLTSAVPHGRRAVPEQAVESFDVIAGQARS